MLTGQAADAHCGLSFCQYGKFNKFYARILCILSIVSIPKLWYYNYRKRKERKKMKIKLKMDCGYVGTDYEEEMEVDDDITEKELEKLAIEFFWENFSGSYSYEIIEE